MNTAALMRGLLELAQSASSLDRNLRALRDRVRELRDQDRAAVRAAKELARTHGGADGGRTAVVTDVRPT